MSCNIHYLSLQIIIITTILYIFIEESNKKKRMTYPCKGSSCTQAILPNQFLDYMTKCMMILIFTGNQYITCLNSSWYNEENIMKSWNSIENSSVDKENSSLGLSIFRIKICYYTHKKD